MYKFWSALIVMTLYFYTPASFMSHGIPSAASGILLEERENLLTMVN